MDAQKAHEGATPEEKVIVEKLEEIERLEDAIEEEILEIIEIEA